MSQVLTNGNDNIYSTTETIVYGLDGEDRIRVSALTGEFFGGAGSDFIGSSETLARTGHFYGGSGNDTLSGQRSWGGYFFGEDGDDLLLSDNVIWSDLNAGIVRLSISARQAPDRLYGGEGADGLYGFGGPDELFGGGGDDQGIISVRTEDGTLTNHRAGLYGGYGHDDLYGGTGDDTLYGGGHNDLLYGDEGNDTLYGDDGDDILFGGEGGSSNNNTYYGGAGHDTAFGGYGPNETMIFYGGAGNDTAIGTSHDDYLEGVADSDFLWGAGGNDALVGGGGDDHIVGYFGSDTLIGGSGADAFNFYYDINTAANDFDYVADFAFGEDYVLFSQTVANDVIFFDFGGVAYAYIPGAAGEAHTIAFDGGATAAQVQASTFFI